MLLLCFSMEDERYALEASRVHKVIPRVSMKRIPKAPDWVAGVMRYQGTIVPVIDLCVLSLERKCRQRLSSRIILVNYRADNKEEHLLGLLAEQVNETMRRPGTDFGASGLEMEETPYLGGIAHDREHMVQWIEIDKLLPVKVQELLFQRDQGAAH
ncbi:chemotaxis-related protein WspB [Mariprofundus ferrinatatus]|uniref:Chemotaxis-related protein WspB n=1 Tax=Mariprofundus ferrinatatus TaxID=1921087 RepID=A0A2K8L5Z2_9PROT|nr:chemotaxis protein CheW [Mariprofundus ferrinatatus]ATX82707.1 chemotaxis-related protein WspB [Mariprofundus ferrinatatus]